jgi:heme-degrading monooxygenase HmoA
MPYTSGRSIAAALCLALLPLAPSHAQFGDAAHFYIYQPKPGQAAAFEDGYRHHLDWHRAHHDPLAWYAWTVEDGPHAGWFVDASMGEPFAAFDRRVDPAGDGADFGRTAAPYATPTARPTYRLLRAYSTGTPLEARHPSVQVEVTYVQVRPGGEQRFERVLAALHGMLAHAKGAPPHTWYRLVVGGRAPQYMLMVARTDWASYDAFPGGLERLLASDPAAIADLAASARGMRSETWRYRPELSLLP